MPRSRTVKGGFFRSPDIQHTPRECRLLFISLWTQADREGRLEDFAYSIRNEAFPYDVDITDEHVEAMLDTLDARNLIVRYVIDAVPLIAVTKWSKHQHPHPKEAASVLPAPPEPPAKARATRAQFIGAGGFAPGYDPVSTQVETDRARTSNTSIVSSTSVSSIPSGAPPSLRSGTPPTLGAENPEPESSAVTPAKKSRAREMAERGTRLPDGWLLPRAWGEWAMHECGFTEAQVREVAATFADYWHAVPGSKGVKLDWLATWRNRCRFVRDGGALRKGNGHGESASEARRRTAAAFGVGPRDRTQGEVFDLPPEDCHVIKH